MSYRVVVDLPEKIKLLHPELFAYEEDGYAEGDGFYSTNEQEWMDYIPDVILLVYEDEKLIISMSYPGNSKAWREKNINDN